MGGYNSKYWVSLNTIRSYDIKTKNNKVIDLRIPEEMDSFGCVVTNDEKYIIIFGGVDDRDTPKAGIYIFDMEQMSVRMSKFHCPKHSKYHAILMGDHN